MNQELYQAVQWDASIGIAIAIATITIGGLAIAAISHLLTIARESILRRRKQLTYSESRFLPIGFPGRATGVLRRKLDEPADLGGWKA